MKLSNIVDVLLVVAVTTLLGSSSAYLDLHYEDHPMFAKGGDISLIYLAQIHAMKPGGICSETWNSIESILAADVFAFAVETINKDKTVLPNITLGFTTFDGCYSNTLQFAHIVKLLKTKYTEEVQALCQEGTAGNASTNAVGVVGPASSQQAVMLSGLLTPLRLPSVAIFTTSDDLSDSKRYL